MVPARVRENLQQPGMSQVFAPFLPVWWLLRQVGYCLQWMVDSLRAQEEPLSCLCQSTREYQCPKSLPSQRVVDFQVLQDEIRLSDIPHGRLALGKIQEVQWLLGFARVLVQVPLVGQVLVLVPQGPESQDSKIELLSGHLLLPDSCCS